MTEASLVLVDTNVILDVTGQDTNRADWSQEQMGRYVGEMIINPLIYNELCYEAGKVADVDAILLAPGLIGRGSRLGLGVRLRGFSRGENKYTHQESNLDLRLRRPT